MADTATEAPAVVVGEFPLNGRDLVRATLGTFNGRPVIALRKWFLAADGEARPTPKGLTLDIRHLPRLAALAADALARAQADGLILPEPEA